MNNIHQHGSNNNNTNSSKNKNDHAQQGEVFLDIPTCRLCIRVSQEQQQRQSTELVLPPWHDIHSRLQQFKSLHKAMYYRNGHLIFVNFGDMKDAKAAKASLHNTVIRGIKLEVSYGKPCRSIWIARVPDQYTSSEQMKRLLSKYGNVIDVRVSDHRYAFVELAGLEDALSVVRGLSYEAPGMIFDFDSRDAEPDAVGIFDEHTYFHEPQIRNSSTTPTSRRHHLIGSQHPRLSRADKRDDKGLHHSVLRHTRIQDRGHEQYHTRDKRVRHRDGYRSSRSSLEDQRGNKRPRMLSLERSPRRRSRSRSPRAPTSRSQARGRPASKSKSPSPARSRSIGSRNSSGRNNDSGAKRMSRSSRMDTTTSSANSTRLAEDIQPHQTNNDDDAATTTYTGREGQQLQQHPESRISCLNDITSTDVSNNGPINKGTAVPVTLSITTNNNNNTTSINNDLTPSAAECDDIWNIIVAVPQGKRKLLIPIRPTETVATLRTKISNRLRESLRDKRIVLVAEEAEAELFGEDLVCEVAKDKCSIRVELEE